MNRLKITNQSAFTIIEVTIVIGLFAILLLGLFSIFDWQNKIYNFEQAEVQATGSARTAMNSLTFTLAQGIRLETSRTISGTNYTTGGGGLVVQLPAYNSSGDLIPSVYDYVAYYSNGTNLYQVTEAGSGSARPAGTKLLSDKLNSFALTYNNGDVTLASEVTVDITTQANYRGNQSVTSNLEETIFLRNK